MGYAMSYASPERDPESNTGTGRENDLGVRMPATNMGLLVAAGVCLLVPIVALMWVGSYNQETPKLSGIPFFFWYQFAWVFVTSALTYTAHRLVLAARGQRDDDDDGHDHATAPPNEPLGDGDTLNPTPGFRS
jgi:hypothetical protein